MLGSAGKAENSGDIDINMDQTQFDKRVVLSTLVSALGPSMVRDHTHVNQIFSCVPIHGDGKNGYVQVDFMFGNKAWQAFSYYSPGPMSRYKGLFRTELIKAAVAFNSDYVRKEDDEVVARVGPTFFHDRGLVWRYRHKAPKKNGQGRVKAFSELTAQDFVQLYPDAPLVEKSVVDQPEGVSELIFGTTNALESFDRYETLTERLRHHYKQDEYGTIMRIFEERLNSLKVDIPKEILDEIFAATSTANGSPPKRD